jgi:hypothetical protein
MSLDRYFAWSPFSLAADQESARHWAGRPRTHSIIKRILVGLQSRPDSTLDVVWASFGAGKTHTLYYIANQLGQSFNLCHLVELPTSLRSFLEFYRLLTNGLSFDRIAQVVIGSERSDIPDDLKRACQLIAFGSSGERALAIQWLRAEKPHLSQLKRMANISSRIEDDLGALEVLSGIVRSLAQAKVRFCVLVDEYQRIGTLPERVQASLTSSLRTLISKNPRGVSIFFAITSLMEQTAMKLVPGELKTIIGIRPIINLPAFNEQEALEFVGDRFRQARPDGFAGEPFEPLTEELVKIVIHFLCQNDALLTPRLTLQVLGDVFDQLTIDPSIGDRHEMRVWLEQTYQGGAVAARDDE